MQTWTVPDKDRVAARVIDGEAVMIDFDTNLYFSLNVSGTQIWNLLEQGAQNAETLARALGEAYPDARSLPDDVAAFMSDLAENALVDVSENDASVQSLDRGDAPYSAPSLTRYDTLDKLIVCGE